MASWRDRSAGLTVIARDNSTMRSFSGRARSRLTNNFSEEERFTGGTRQYSAGTCRNGANSGIAGLILLAGQGGKKIRKRSTPNGEVQPIREAVAPNLIKH